MPTPIANARRPKRQAFWGDARILESRTYLGRRASFHISILPPTLKRLKSPLVFHLGPCCTE
ncbi:hypothetical protein PG984_001615 [Apiospora sp. TS-2023a]